MEFDLSDEDLESLLLYSSAQTPLDTLFGTDGFLSLRGQFSSLMWLVMKKKILQK